MNKKFARMVERLHPLFLKLKNGPTLSSAKNMPRKGVYLFSKNGKHLYVGRSNNIPRRYRAHRGAGSNHNSASFAYLLACKTCRSPRASYRKGDGRKERMGKRKFRKAFDDAKQRIRAMEFRAVREDNQKRQALLEVYCAVALA